MSKKKKKEIKVIKVICIGCKKEVMVDGDDGYGYICMDCTKIIENIAKKRYDVLRFIADIETGIYQTDIIKKRQLQQEFNEFLRDRGYKI